MIGWYREETQYAVGDDYIFTNFRIATDIDFAYDSVTNGIEYLFNNTTATDITPYITSVSGNIIYVQSGYINTGDKITIHYYADFESEPVQRGETLTGKQLSNILSALSYMDTLALAQTGKVVNGSRISGSVIVPGAGSAWSSNLLTSPTIASMIVFSWSSSESVSSVGFEIDGEQSILTVGIPPSDGASEDEKRAIPSGKYDAFEIYERGDRKILKLWLGAVRINSSFKIYGETTNPEGVVIFCSVVALL